MNISQLFQQAAKAHPETIAIIDGNRSITYAALLEEVKKTAAYFHKKGIQSGDRVLVFVPMCIDLYRIVLALFYMGASAVFLDEWVSRERLDLCCALADCKGFIGIRKARIYAFFSKALRRIPIKLALKKMHTDTMTMADVDTNSTALITFTTGSTGTPKAADRSHGFLQAQFDALIDEINPKVGEVDMTVLPIVLFVNLGTGCTSVIADFKMSKVDQMDVEKITQQIVQHQVSRIIASPFFIKKLAEHGVKNTNVFSEVKNIFTGGAPVFPKEASLFMAGFTKAEIKLVYGSTEAEPISSIDARTLVSQAEALSSGLPVGHMFHKIEVRIIHLEAEAQDCHTEADLCGLLGDEGMVGEIIVAGDHVLKRYFKNELAFKENKIVTEKQIWHRTGDSGFIQNDQLYLTGRCKQLIYKDGKLISPFIIENILLSVDDVRIGTVLEVNHEVVLIVASSLAPEDLKQRLQKLNYDRLVVVDTIPRDPRHHTKIDYDKLLSLIQQKI